MTRLAAHSPAPPDRPLRTGLARAVLAETAQKLNAFIETGEEGAVDLAGLPMTPADYAELDETLGRGEVEIALHVAGESEIWETGYPGVWRVRHRGAGERVSSEELLITRIPEIVTTHVEDSRAAAARLDRVLMEQTAS